MELWIARDIDTDTLCIFNHKPLFDAYKQIFVVDVSIRGSVGIILPKDWFPEVTFENSPKKLRVCV